MGVYVSEPSSVPVPGAVRLIFSTDGDDVTLLSQQRVDVAVTGFDAAPEERSGHFVEVRGIDGQALTRVPVHAAFPDTVEVFPENHDEAIIRVPNLNRSSAFTVVVPARSDARSVALIRVAGVVPAGQPPVADAAPPATTELATFELEV